MKRWPYLTCMGDDALLNAGRQFPSQQALNHVSESTFLCKMSVRQILKAKVKPVILVLFVELHHLTSNIAIQLNCCSSHFIWFKFAFPIKTVSECYLCMAQYLSLITNCTHSLQEQCQLGSLH